MAGIYNFNWAQGEDLVISLTYKTGPKGSETAVDLTNYDLRMDIAAGGTVVYTATDTDGEAVLGADGTIRITVPRAAALEGGTVYDAIAAGTNTFDYDIFLRDAGGVQTKILKGQIYADKSVTLWP